MLSVIVGLTGVGKSSVLQKTRKNSPNFESVNYGDILLELAKEEGVAEHRDELTEIEPELYSELQEEVPHRVVEKSEGTLLVLDTHAALDTPSGYRPGLPAKTINTLNPDNITFIRAPPNEIQSRRRTDESRDRTVPSIQKLKEQQEIAINMASTGAVLAHSTLEIINNPDGGLETAATEYAQVLSEIS